MHCKRTFCAFGRTGGADVTPEQYDPMAKIAALIRRKDFAQLFFHFFRFFTFGETQPSTDSDAMGITDNASGGVVQITHQKIGCFASYTGQFQQLLHSAGHFGLVITDQHLTAVDDILNHRNIFDSASAAMYHPWVKVFDPLTKNTAAIPPSGSVAGIYARTDNARGVWKAPANEVVSACVGLDVSYNTREQDILNPKGVNLIRSFPGQGIRVWGARTLSSNAQWKYINVKRLFIFLEESIKANTNWVVFEPNDNVLWLRVRRTIEVFLSNMWKSGAFAGGSEGEAFFVDIGENTMSKDDIDNGRLVCVIGIAPVKPAEFVIFRLTQKTADQ